MNCWIQNYFQFKGITRLLFRNKIDIWFMRWVIVNTNRFNSVCNFYLVVTTGFSSDVHSRSIKAATDWQYLNRFHLQCWTTYNISEKLSLNSGCQSCFGWNHRLKMCSKKILWYQSWVIISISRLVTVSLILILTAHDKERRNEQLIAVATFERNL